MATFLELVNTVGRESGTIDSTQALTTFTDASPRHRKIMGWVAEAWVQIQNARRDFNWRRSTFSHALTINQTTYTPAQLGVTDFARWLRPREEFQPISLYDPADGQGNEMALRSMDYFEWYKCYGRGAHSANRPVVYAEDKGGVLLFGPKPDKAYIARGFYLRSPQQLIDDDDEPIAPEEFHNVIIYKALLLLAEHDEAQFPLATANMRFSEAYGALVRETTPDMII